MKEGVWFKFGFNVYGSSVGQSSAGKLEINYFFGVGRVWSIKRKDTCDVYGPMSFPANRYSFDE